MTTDEILRMGQQAGLQWCQFTGCFKVSDNDMSAVDALQRFAAMAAAAEREACIAKIQAQIDHAHINELRLAPRFGKRLGEIAVRADDLEATLDSLRARSQQ